MWNICSSMYYNHFELSDIHLATKMSRGHFHYRYENRDAVSSWDSPFSQRQGKRFTEQELHAVSEKLSQRLSELDWASLAFYLYWHCQSWWTFKWSPNWRWKLRHWKDSFFLVTVKIILRLSKRTQDEKCSPGLSWYSQIWYRFI